MHPSCLCGRLKSPRSERTIAHACVVHAPIVIPLGLIAISVAYAIYHAYAYTPAKLKTVAIGVYDGTAPSGVSARRWRA